MRSPGGVVVRHRSHLSVDKDNLFPGKNAKSPHAFTRYSDRRAGHSGKGGRGIRSGGLPDVPVNPICRPDLFLPAHVCIFSGITDSEETGEFVFLGSAYEPFHMFRLVADGNPERARQPLSRRRQQDIFDRRPRRGEIVERTLIRRPAQRILRWTGISFRPLRC